MIEVNDFVNKFERRGYNFWTGVPCSILEPVINYLGQCSEATYIIASSEGEATGIAAGAYLTGRKTVAICQNSGLGNMVDPLTSLNHVFHIPSILIITLRGAPGERDAPQHAFMGAITQDMLSTLRIPCRILPDRPDEIDSILNEADDYIAEKNLPYALIMKRGIIAPYQSGGSKSCTYYDKAHVAGDLENELSRRPSRNQAIKIIRDIFASGELIVATTGKAGRELYDLGHRSNQFYLLGAMGCASAVGLGLALCLSKRKIVVIDGDGAALMRMGTLATIGYYHPDNLIHIILDNESHESTGGQPTVSSCTDFAQVAAACSYSTIFRCDSESSLGKSLKSALSAHGPVCIHVKISTRKDTSPGRPDIIPLVLKEQFMAYIANGQGN